MEPSTGRRYPVAQSPYLGIELLWNHRNLWVCTQMPEPHSDSRADPAKVSFDLADPAKWQAVLDDGSAAVRRAVSLLSAVARLIVCLQRFVTD